MSSVPRIPDNQPTAPNTSVITKKRRMSPPLKLFLITIAVIVLIPIILGVSLLIYGRVNDSLVESRLRAVKSDIIVPPGCKETDEGYVSGIDNGQRYNVNYQCDKTLSPDEINSYLATEYPKKGYQYVSGDSQNTAYKTGIMIDYYGETYNINAEPTNKISANISEN